MRNGSATAHSVKDIQKEMRVLKAKLNELAESIGEDATDAASSFMDKAPKIAKGYTDDILESALDSAKSLGDVAAKHVVESIKDRPMGTLAAIIGIGFLAGYLCRRD